MPKTIATPRSVPITALGNGVLHRAIVSLPQHMTERDRPLQERIVFFEVPASHRSRGAFTSSGSGEHLERLLATAWCIDTTNWCENGYLYNINTAQELYGNAFGHEATGELRLFETGCGGETFPAIGPGRIHYARAGDVDLFVPPRVVTRLRELSDVIEDLYGVETAAKV